MESAAAISIVDSLSERDLQCFFKSDKSSKFYDSDIKWPIKCSDLDCEHLDNVVACPGLEIGGFSYEKKNSETVQALQKLLKDPVELTELLISDIVLAMKLKNTSGYEVFPLKEVSLLAWLCKYLGKKVMFTSW